MVRNEKLLFFCPHSTNLPGLVQRSTSLQKIWIFHLTLLKTVGCCCSFGFFLFLFLSLLLSSFIIYADVLLLLILSDDITLMILFHVDIIVDDKFCPYFGCCLFHT